MPRGPRDNETVKLSENATTFISKVLQRWCLFILGTYKMKHLIKKLHTKKIKCKV